jgi:hypothetical protein
MLFFILMVFKHGNSSTPLQTDLLMFVVQQKLLTGKRILLMYKFN